MRTSLSRIAKPASQYGRLMRACCESLEGRRLLSVVTTGDQFGSVGGKNLTLQQTDVDGDIVKYSLTGGGTGQILGNTLMLTNTTKSSNLSITVKRAGGGDGVVTITGIQTDSVMRSINGQAAVVAGDVLMNTGATSTSSTATINLREMRDGNINTGGQALSSVKLQNWAPSMSVDQALTAPWVGTLNVTGKSGTGLPGDMGATVAMTDRDQRVVALKTATIGGVLNNIDAPSGGIGTLQAGAINGTVSALFIGTLRTRALKGSATADGSASGEIRALGSSPDGKKAALATLQVNGDTNFLTIRADESSLGNITITGNALDTTIFTVGGAQNIRVGQVFSTSRIQTQAGVNAITFGSMNSSNVLVGVAPDFSGDLVNTAAGFADGADTPARLGSFTVGKKQAANATAQVTGANNLSAAQLGKVSVFNMESTTPPSLQIYTLETANGKNPAAVRYTDNTTPANSFNWKAGQQWPELLQQMLTLVS